MTAMTKARYTMLGMK
jgi:hypothetical protein